MRGLDAPSDQLGSRRPAWMPEMTPSLMYRDVVHWADVEERGSGGAAWATPSSGGRLDRALAGWGATAAACDCSAGARATGAREGLRCRPTPRECGCLRGAVRACVAFRRAGCHRSEERRVGQE